jgi:hypothetical protein
MPPEEPEQITINGKEYDPEDAAQLIELGSKWRKTESDLNTSLDKVYPEYTRATQRNKELETELAERNAKLDEYQRETEARKVKAETPEEIQNARKAARELGLLDEDSIKEKGYMTREEMKDFLAQEQTQRKLVEGVEKQGKQLESDIDGSDGRVPFVYKSVLPYAATYKIDDLKEAYEQMNERANARWKEAQIAREDKGGLSTLRSAGGKKEPQRPKITNDNLGAALGEWLDEVNS